MSIHIKKYHQGLKLIEFTFFSCISILGSLLFGLTMASIRWKESIPSVFISTGIVIPLLVWRSYYVYRKWIVTFFLVIVLLIFFPVGFFFGWHPGLYYAFIGLDVEEIVNMIKIIYQD
jgi:hypothetical protein